MKSNIYLKSSLLFLFLFFGAILLINLQYNIEENKRNTIKTKKINDDITENTLMISDYWEFDFIHIDGNWSVAEDTEWCDIINGIYIIENITIDATNSPIEAGIKIENSEDCFIIRNCTVNNGNDYGIFLDNAHNGTLYNNTISYNYGEGIYSTQSNNLTIIENIINNNGRDGIELSEFENITISGNTITYNDNEGLELYDGKNNTISGNIITNNGGDGVYIDWVENITITDNNISNNDDNGILLEDCEDILVLNNTLIDNTLNIYDPYSIDLLKNTMTGCGIAIQSYSLFYLNSINIDNTNKVNGKTIYYKNGETNLNPIDPGQIILIECSDSIISNLDLIDCSVGFALYYCNNITINDNIANNNDKFGIYSIECENITISNNIFNNNEYSGISLDYCDNNTISGNAANSNWDYGIEMDESDNNTISGNTILYNWDGINIYDSNNNTISGNTILYNGDGIDINDSSNNTIVSNTISNNEDDGLELDECSFNYIIDNTINNNDYSGIYLEYSNYNKIIGNTIHCNGVCWEQYECEGNVFLNNDCNCPSGDDDDDDDENEASAIPSFPISLLIGIMWILIFLIIIWNKVKRSYIFK